LGEPLFIRLVLGSRMAVVAYGLHEN